jgi:hypothetical protein
MQLRGAYGAHRYAPRPRLALGWGRGLWLARVFKGAQPHESSVVCTEKSAATIRACMRA